MNTTLFIAATHGDEGYSIPVFKMLEKAYPKEEYSYDWVIGNPRALAAGLRYTEIDMNRSAPGDQNGVHYEERRAAELIALGSEYDEVIDVHGSSAACGATIIVPLPKAANLELAARFKIKRNVVWYSTNSVIRGPLAQHMPVPSIELEFGPKSDPDVAASLYKVLAGFLQSKNEKLLRNEVVSGAKFYDVYGKCYTMELENVTDFSTVTDGNEKFFAYMSEVYEGVKCYKATRCTYEEIAAKYENVLKDIT